MIKLLFATLIIKSLTRFNSCIDHIITNIENVSDYTEQPHNSGHFVQIVTYEYKSFPYKETFYFRPVNERN